MTKQGINNQRSVIKFSCSLPLTCLITRGETLLPLAFNFCSPLTSTTFFLFERAKLFSDTFKLCLSQYSIAFYRSYSKTITNCVFTKIHHHHRTSWTTEWSFTPQSTCQYPHPTSVLVSSNFALI